MYRSILLKVGQMYWSERCDGDISSYCVSGVSDFEIVEISDYNEDDDDDKDDDIFLGNLAHNKLRLSHWHLEETIAYF